ncbi:MAG: hypothetical protein R3C26_23450 [Calditrichia bacterium]
MAEVYELLAKIHHRQKEWELGIGKLPHQAQELFHDTKQESNTLFAQIAVIYQKWVKLIARWSCLKALAINERLGESPGVARILRRLAIFINSVAKIYLTQ